VSERAAPIAVVLAGGRSRRMGSPKALVELGGRPLLAWALAAALEAGLETVVVAKPGSELPPLDVPLWPEPERPAHPLTGVVAALERAAPRAIVVLACDMPFVPAELIARLAALDAVAAAPPGEAFPARYEPGALPALRAGLEREAPLRAVLARLAPVEVAAGGGEHALLGINDPETLARAAALLR
jgi:molybdenum cofactor guanylyltransferase